MAKIIYDYYESNADDVYTDGDIENELLSYARDGKNDWYADGRWPVVYHMSHLRHNILNWFPFNQNCSILEIGAGCGALTGLLCERAEKVVSVELTKRRAEINFERHKNYDNLEIIVSDFQKVPKQWKFDYVIINGVLEYAAYLIDSANPYEKFLELSAMHLKPNGKVLLAIENRLGLKYFSGAREDHTGEFFSGLNGYSKGEKIKTFSKEELVVLLRNAKLFPLKFYYPYPDYKFPSEIFTDSSVNLYKPSVIDYSMDMSRVRLFDEKMVYSSFMQLQVMDKFSNSFLVEASLDPNNVPSDISYVKISSNRDEKFRICTILNEGKTCVYKKALHPRGYEHIKNMSSFNGFKYDRNGILKNVECIYEEQSTISYPYIKAPTFEEVLIEAYQQKDFGLMKSHIKRFCELLFESIDLIEQPVSHVFEEIFGKKRCLKKLHWMENANVDLISGNVFVINDEYQVIDYEWHVPCSVPQEFVIWRMLRQFIENNSLENIITKSAIFDLLNIDEHTEQCFIDWEMHFVKYVGINDLHRLSKDIVPLDIEKITADIFKSLKIESTLFFDFGNGYSDSDYERVLADYSPQGFSVTFTTDNLRKARMLRWDPIEGNACYINVHKIETDGQLQAVEPLNHEEYKGGDLGYEFFTFDPQFQITGDFSNASFLKVYFSCKIIDWTYGYKKREVEVYEYKQKLEEQMIINQKLTNNLKESEKLTSDFNMRLEELINFIKNELSKKTEELENTKEQLKKATNEIISTKNDLNKKSEELQEALYNLKANELDLQKVKSERDRFIAELKVTQAETNSTKVKLENVESELKKKQDEMLNIQNLNIKLQEEIIQLINIRNLLENELAHTRNALKLLKNQMSDHRFKTAIKVLFFGGVE